MCSVEHTSAPGLIRKKRREEKDMNRGWQGNTGADFPKSSFYLMEDVNSG